MEQNMTEQDLGVQKRYNRIMRTAIFICRHLWYTLKRLDKTNERGDPGQMHLYTLKESISGPVILWGMYPFQEGEKERTAQTISDWMGEISYTLIAFQVTDWNRDFSPWKTESLSESFSGGAKDTLRCLLEEQIPKIRQQYGQDRELYLMGYSLAGLFALWTAYQTDLLQEWQAAPVPSGIRDLCRISESRNLQGAGGSTSAWEERKPEAEMSLWQRWESGLARSCSFWQRTIW